MRFRIYSDIPIQIAHLFN